MLTMAKRQAGTKKPSSSGNASAEEIRAAKRKILDAHSLGKQVKEKCGTRTSEPALRDAAHELGITPALAKRYRVLATEGKGFTEVQLKKLLSLFDKKQRALNITHVLSLLKIKDQKRRLTLAREALERNWSAHRLHQRVLASAGKLHRGGRKYKLPDDKKELLVFVDRGLRSWHGWLAALVDPAQKDLPRELKEKFRELKSKVEELHQVYFKDSAEEVALMKAESPNA